MLQNNIGCNSELYEWYVFTCIYCNVYNETRLYYHFGMIVVLGFYNSNDIKQ